MEFMQKKWSANEVGRRDEPVDNVGGPPDAWPRPQSRSKPQPESPLKADMDSGATLQHGAWAFYKLIIGNNSSPLVTHGS